MIEESCFSVFGGPCVLHSLLRIQSFVLPAEVRSYGSVYFFVSIPAFSDIDVHYFLVCTRSMWQRAGAVRLFAEHVTLCAEDDNATTEIVVRLWKVLTTKFFKGTLSRWQNLEKSGCLFGSDLELLVVSQ